LKINRYSENQNKECFVKIKRFTKRISIKVNTKEYISSGIIESYVLGIATREEAAIFECIL